MPNNDYILRADALKAVCENCSMHGDEGEPCSSRCEDYALVLKIPTADVEPVRHGHYIGTEFDGYADGNPVYYEWKCSECDCVFEDDEPKYRYCPNCGAKMDAEPQEE